MTVILACDPGKASGFAVYELETCQAVYMAQSENGVLGFKSVFTELVEECLPTHIVCERFDLRSSNKFLADLSPVECIGWLKGEGYTGVEYVTPSQHKTLVKDHTLNPLMKSGNFKVGAGHSRDALRIALWYAAMRLKHIPTLEMLKAKENSVS